MLSIHRKLEQICEDERFEKSWQSVTKNAAALVIMRNDEQELFQKALFLFPMLSRKPEMRAVEPIVESVRISQRALCKNKIQKRKGKFQYKGEFE